MQSDAAGGIDRPSEAFRQRRIETRVGDKQQDDALVEKPVHRFVRESLPPPAVVHEQGFVPSRFAVKGGERFKREVGHSAVPHSEVRVRVNPQEAAITSETLTFQSESAERLPAAGPRASTPRACRGA